MKVLIAGDTCPTDVASVTFSRERPNILGNALRRVFDSVDFRIANLECPLTDAESPIFKVGPVLSAPTACVAGLSDLKIDLAGLANNHIMDHGEAGLDSTLKALDAAGIRHVGAGHNLGLAQRMFVSDLGGIRFGVLAVAEQEFNIATDTRAGASPIDLASMTRTTDHLREQCDFLLILIHGGNEGYPYPSPPLARLCRFLAERGAGAIICQHSHCIGAMETFNGVPIIYGQGNFIFPGVGGEWNTGLVVVLTIDEKSRHAEACVHYIQQENGTAELIPHEEADALSEGFSQRSAHLLDADTLEQEWRLFCTSRARYYLNAIDGAKSPFRRIAVRLGMGAFFDTPQKQLQRLNLIRCLSHRDALVTVLTSQIESSIGRDTL